MQLAQARRSKRHTVVALDQIGQFRRAATFEEGDDVSLQISHG